MRNAPTNNSCPPGQINRAKIRSALGGLIGSKPADDTQIEVTEYDWHQPHYFSSSQLAKLNNFTKKTATVMAEKFTQLYNSDFNVTITSTTQHFAGELFDQILSSGQNDYYLAFGPDQQPPRLLGPPPRLASGARPTEASGGRNAGAGEDKSGGGFISIPAQTAAAWAKQLLGDPAPEKDASAELHPPEAGKPSKALSQLEESLLFDIASAIVESLSISLPATGGPLADYNFQPASELVKGSAPSLLQGQGTAELCKITFDVQKADSEDNAETPLRGNQAHLLIPANMLAPMVGKITETDKKLSAQDSPAQGGQVSKAIFEHLQQMPISITAQLAVAVLTFEQLISLRPSDVLLLNKAIDGPVELIVEGRTLFRGRPAKSAGQHAVVITELSGNAE
ncbi:MAG: FliM/FliN family flagellar motor switch protein [Phycisphaerae bacterium]